MEQFKIHIPEGQEIDLDKSNLTKGDIFFKKKEIKLPTTNKECGEFFKEGGYYIDINGSILPCTGFTGVDKNFIRTREYAYAFIALMQLIKYRDIWNEGWIANWTNHEYKYIIYFYDNKKSQRTEAGSARRGVLCFKTIELRDKFSEEFDYLIYQAKPLL